MKAYLFLFLIFFIVESVFSQQKTKTNQIELKTEIEKIISTKKGDIGVSILTENNDVIAINGDKCYPMLSTFKFPIALTILHKVENGELSMQQQVFIKKEELLENTWSPFKEKYPDGNISISLEEAITWMIDYSDNNMTDILLRLIGGTESVQKFIDNQNFIIKNNEEEMHKDWESQFVNKITPNFFTQLLKKFDEGELINKKNTEWLYQAMVDSHTGLKRLKSNLPDVRIAQRAGTSFTNDEGITGAINNIGIIELPNKQKIYIAVFIHNTSEEFSNGEETIADIAKAAYDYYTLNSFESTNYAKQIDSLLSVETSKPFNGVILATKDGKVTYSKACGYSDLDTKIPLKIDNQFSVGSISKQFTATIVLQEYDKGHLDIYVPIKKYFPNLTKSWADTVTIHQLLTHTHGIIALDKPTIFAVGTQFAYSQIGYDLLAKIVEKTSGKSFIELSDELFRKCGMHHTFHPDLKEYKNLVKGYIENDEGKLEYTNESFSNTSVPLKLGVLKIK